MSGANNPIESIWSLITYKPPTVQQSIDANISFNDGLHDQPDSTNVRQLAEGEGLIRRLGGRQLDAFVSLNLLAPNSKRGIDAHVLIDSGCTGSCIDLGFVKHYDIPTKRYPNPLRVSNADGSFNEGGLITDYAEVELIFEDHKEAITLLVTTLSSSNIFLGHDWLTRHNPEIDWRLGTIEFTRCPETCAVRTPSPHPNHIRVRQMAGDKPTKEKWPSYLNDFANVFSEKGFEQLPEHCTWDHAIELKSDFKPSDCKIYPLSPKEQQALKEFIDENLASGCI